MRLPGGQARRRRRQAARARRPARRRGGTARPPEAAGTVVPWHPRSTSSSPRCSAAAPRRRSRADSGLATVGDLLAHYPRRYARRGELTALDAASDRRERHDRRRGARGAGPLDAGQARLDPRGGHQRRHGHAHAHLLQPGLAGQRAASPACAASSRARSATIAGPGSSRIPTTSSSTGTRGPGARRRRGPSCRSRSTRRRRRSRAGRCRRRSGIVLDTLPDARRPGSGCGASAARARRRTATPSSSSTGPQVDADWGAARDGAALPGGVRAAGRAAAAARAAAGVRGDRARSPARLLEGFDAALPFALTDDQVAVGRRDRRRPRGARPDEPARAGRGRLGQDPRRAAGDARGRRVRRAVGAARADRGARRASTCARSSRTLGPDLAARLRPTLLTGQLPTARAQEGAARGGDGLGLDRRRHACAAGRRRGLLRPRARRRRRAAPLRGRAARGPAAQGRAAAARARAHRDADPAHRRDDGVRRPRRLAPSRSFRPGARRSRRHVVPLAEKPGWAARVWERMAEELAQGRQGFVVCPAIDATPARSR